MKKQQALTDEDFLLMDESEFRARFRARLHHTLEVQLYSATYRGKKLSPKQTDYTKRLMKRWENKGLSKKLPDYVFAEEFSWFCRRFS